MKCAECEKIEQRSGQVVYSDPVSHIILPEKPAAKGHVKIYTKKHVESLDELNHDEVEHLYETASRTATMLFELLGAEGTNIILNEGSVSEGHLNFDVVARSSEDNINTQWEPKELDESTLQETADRIRRDADLIGHEEETTQTQKETSSTSSKTVDKDDPRVKYLKRLP